jgi:hypothetical protein
MKLFKIQAGFYNPTETDRRYKHGLVVSHYVAESYENAVEQFTAAFPELELSHFSLKETKKYEAA